MYQCMLLNALKLKKCVIKLFNIHPSIIAFVPECFQTQEMGDKAVDSCPFVFDSIPD